MTIIDIIGPFDFKTGMQPIEYTTNRERGCLEEQELVELKRAYEAQVAKKFPSAPQLRRKDAAERSDETVFLV